MQVDTCLGSPCRMIVPLFEGKVPVFLSEIGIMRMWILPLHQFQGNDDSEECFTAIVKSARRKASVGSRSVADAFAYAASHDQDACVVSQASIQAGREQYCFAAIGVSFSMRLALAGSNCGHKCISCQIYKICNFDTMSEYALIAGWDINKTKACIVHLQVCAIQAQSDIHKDVAAYTQARSLIVGETIWKDLKQHAARLHEHRIGQPCI